MLLRKPPHTSFTCTIDDIIKGKHNFGIDTFKIMLSNTKPDRVKNKYYSDIKEIESVDYPKGGINIPDQQYIKRGGSNNLIGKPIIFKAKTGLPSFLTSDTETIALRCPKHNNLQKLFTKI